MNVKVNVLIIQSINNAIVRLYSMRRGELAFWSALESGPFGVRFRAGSVRALQNRLGALYMYRLEGGSPRHRIVVAKNVCAQNSNGNHINTTHGHEACYRYDCIYMGMHSFWRACVHKRFFILIYGIWRQSERVNVCRFIKNVSNCQPPPPSTKPVRMFTNVD